MFTGLVEAIGAINSIAARGAGRELVISAPALILKNLRIGDSIAVDGCCQTVIKISRGNFSVISVEETLRKTIFGNYAAGVRVNLERPMRADGRFGGHFVTGHIDGIARLLSLSGDDTSRIYTFSLPKNFSNLVIPVGSISVNGVSLTVARVAQKSFSVAIIPHTFEHTTFQFLQPGDSVNIEYDMLGKYVARIAEGKR